MTNYLSNAIHHLEGDRRIEISCSRSQNAGDPGTNNQNKNSADIITVSVFNRGKPIPEADIDRIWEKFYKVDKAHTRAYGGSGIGLSIVKAIMEQHGQTCRAENREDGVVFSFTLEG